MPTAEREIETLANREYKWGFVTDIEADSLPPGLNEDVVRFISRKKGEPQWMLDWRLKAYRHWPAVAGAHGCRALADEGGAARVAEAALPADRLPGGQLLLGAQAEEEPG